METSACPAEGRESGRECFSRTLGAYNGIARGCCLSRGPQVNLLAHPLFPQQSQEVRLAPFFAEHRLAQFADTCLVEAI